MSDWQHVVDANWIEALWQRAEQPGLSRPGWYPTKMHRLLQMAPPHPLTQTLQQRWHTAWQDVDTNLPIVHAQPSVNSEQSAVNGIHSTENSQQTPIAPSPVTLNPQHPTPHTLHPTPHTPHLTPNTSHPAPDTPHPTPETPSPPPSANPSSSTIGIIQRKPIASGQTPLTHTMSTPFGSHGTASQSSQSQVTSVLSEPLVAPTFSSPVTLPIVLPSYAMPFGQAELNEQLPIVQPPPLPSRQSTTMLAEHSQFATDTSHSLPSNSPKVVTSELATNNIQHSPMLHTVPPPMLSPSPAPTTPPKVRDYHPTPIVHVNQPSTINHQNITTTHQPTTTYQPPTTSHQPPATNHQPPATNHQPPATNHQPPTTSHQPPATNEDAIVARVRREFMRDLEIERERRGWTHS